MEPIEIRLSLKNRREVLLRGMRTDGLEPSFAFFAGLPPEDRKYLRHDVTRPEVVERRIADVTCGRVLSLVALECGSIIADGGLELEGSWLGQKLRRDLPDRGRSAPAPGPRQFDGPRAVLPRHQAQG